MGKTINSLKTTPLYESHKAQNAKIAEFGGFLMPMQYESALVEHLWCREKAAVFDTSHMGQFLITGGTAESELNRIVTIDTAKIGVFKCKYGLMLNNRAGIKDDLIIYKINPNEFMVVVNSATCDSDMEHIKTNLNKAHLKPLNHRYGKIDIQGPKSEDVLNRNFNIDVSGLKYFEFGYFTIGSEDCIISRTGYTGEKGYELYLKADKLLAVWNKLLDDPRVKPAGLAARNTLRLEAGLPLYGQDITETTTPIEAGLEKYVDFDSEFIGKNKLIENRSRLFRKLMFFKSLTRRAPRPGYKIYISGEFAGTVTSGTFSPGLQCGIGAGYINNLNINTGGPITVKNDSRQIECIIVDKPFYRSDNRLQTVDHRL